MESRAQSSAEATDADYGRLKMSYVVATPEVATMPLAWAGWPDSVLADIAEIGYRGIELQTRDPARLDRRAIARSLERAGLVATGVSTGAIPNEDGLFMTLPERGHSRGGNRAAHRSSGVRRGTRYAHDNRERARLSQMGSRRIHRYVMVPVCSGPRACPC